MSATTTSAAPITAENILRLFPDIDTRGEALEGHDEEQIRLMDEVCIVTDENDLPIGTASKKLCKLPQSAIRAHRNPRPINGQSRPGRTLY
jgi:isopentenyl-diphosphate delta-isomerase